MESALDNIIDLLVDEDDIEKNILRAWSTPSGHVKTLVSLPPELFNELVQNLDVLRSYFEDEDPTMSGYAYSISQAVFFGHLLVSGVNVLKEKHARREETKKNEMKEAALNFLTAEYNRREETKRSDAEGTPQINTEDRQAAAIEQYLKKSK